MVNVNQYERMLMVGWGKGWRVVLACGVVYHGIQYMKNATWNM